MIILKKDINALPLVQTYLYSSGTFILISKTEDTKYMPYK